MDQGNQDVYTDELFVGLTRPATALGIPYNALVIEVVSVAIVFLAIGNPFYLLLIAPLHAVLYAISGNNPRAFEGMFVWLKTQGRCRNTRFWRAASFSPTGPKWRKE